MRRFRVQVIGVSYEAQEVIAFPAGRTANLLRGLIGAALHRHYCRCGSESHGDDCLYARLFKGSTPAARPSGFRDVTPPFVLRAQNLAGRAFAEGERFGFRLCVFSDEAELYADALRDLMVDGIGPTRGRARLAAEDMKVYELPLDAEEPCQEVTLRFETATELKSGGEVIDTPRFDVLFARLLERLMLLAYLYQEPLTLEPASLLTLAQEVELVDYDWWHQPSTRRSHEGVEHPLSGYLGTAYYTGPLDRLLPILRVAEYVGVGRNTVWGHGMVRVALD